jgi:hypothetical protein
MRILAALAAIAAIGLGLAVAERKGALPCCATEPSAKTNSGTAPLSCSLTDRQARERKDKLAVLLTDAAVSAVKAETGYTVTLAEGHAPEIAEFIELERACCPFFAFTLAFAPEKGPITLTIDGPPGSQAFTEELLKPILKKMR